MEFSDHWMHWLTAIRQLKRVRYYKRLHKTSKIIIHSTKYFKAFMIILIIGDIFFDAYSVIQSSNVIKWTPFCIYKIFLFESVHYILSIRVFPSEKIKYLLLYSNPINSVCSQMVHASSSSM